MGTVEPEKKDDNKEREAAVRGRCNMSSLVQVLEPNPDVVQTWHNEKLLWEALNKETLDNQEFQPIAIKAMYVLGVIHGICTSVTFLLKGPLKATYLSAYGVFASGIDLLGRCIRGNDTQYTAPQRGLPSDLEEGYRWLADSYFRGNVPNEIVQTSSNRYTVGNLVALRHFAAHGQATTQYQLQDIDYEIIEGSKPLLIEGLDTYWERLKNGDQGLSNNLARANVRGFRALPIQVTQRLFNPDPITNEYPSVLKIFSEFDWKVVI
jgi:hypothetical protein